jgi:hypothetical protein
MSPVTLILLAAATVYRVDAERAAERIRQAQYCAAVGGVLSTVRSDASSGWPRQT